MHRSRIGVVLVDVSTDDYDAAEDFWSAVTGRPAVPEPDGEPYAGLGGLGGVHLALQRTGTGTAARVHLDVETDDVPAEVDRLVSLGARLTERRDDYAVLADPTGHPFCVVPVQTGPDFAPNARTWD